MQQSTISRLEQDIEEIQSHHESAPVRVRDYYENPSESEFETAPHDQQFQKAAHYIEYAIKEVAPPRKYAADFEDDDISIDWLSRRDWSRLQIQDMLFGIAIELIVSAIHLKLETREYVENLLRRNQTPRIGDSKEVLLDDLADQLDESEIREVELVLKLATEKRNNLVHFGFHAQHAHYFPALFIDLSGFLITRYADTDEIPELESLVQYRADYADRRGEAELYPKISVDFESFDDLDSNQ